MPEFTRVRRQNLAWKTLSSNPNQIIGSFLETVPYYKGIYPDHYFVFGLHVMQRGASVVLWQKPVRDNLSAQVIWEATTKYLDGLDPDILASHKRHGWVMTMDAHARFA